MMVLRLDLMVRTGRLARDKGPLHSENFPLPVRTLLIRNEASPLQITVLVQNYIKFK